MLASDDGACRARCSSSLRPTPPLVHLCPNCKRDENTNYQHHYIERHDAFPFVVRVAIRGVWSNAVTVGRERPMQEMCLAAHRNSRGKRACSHKRGIMTGSHRQSPRSNLSSLCDSYNNDFPIISKSYSAERHISG